MNVENAEKLAAYLEALPPDKFDMWSYCGTACCLAGHAFLLATGEDRSIDMIRVRDTACKWLGIYDDQAATLFEPDDDLSDDESGDEFQKRRLSGPWGFFHMASVCGAATPQQGAKALRRAIELWS